METMSIEELVKKLREASTAYYGSGEPLMTDDQFDNLVYELEKRDPDNKFLKETGWGMDNTNSDTELVVPMSGISDKRRFSYSDSVDVQANEVYTPKLDGLAVQLVYEDGRLVDAITRGNGKKGKCKLDHMKGLVPNIVSPNIEVVSGELMMDYDTFAKNYDVSTQHPRNVASGILNRNDTKDMDKLTFVAYRVLKYKNIDAIPDVIYTDVDNLSFYVAYRSMLMQLVSNGFNVVNPVSSNINSRCLGEVIDQGFTLTTYDYASNGSVECKVKVFKCDGLVFSKNVLKVSSEGLVNYDGVYCKKVDNEYAITKVVGIDWSMGATGRYVPTALLEPVSLGGCVIKRATANNLKWAKEMNIGIGSEVKIIRSGEIIPKIIEVLTPMDDLVEPIHCKYCGSELVHSGVDLVCNNPSCEGLLNNRLHRFLGTFSYGVKGVGYSTIQDVISYNDIKSIKDIFNINYRQVYSSGSKTDNLIIKMFEQLKEPRTVDYFLVGVSVPKLSWKGAAEYIKTDICKLLNGEDVELTRPKGTNSYAYQYILNNLDELRELYKYCNIVDESDKVEDNDSKLKICITGGLNNFSKRGEVFEKYSDKIVESSIKSADYLVTNNQESTSSKMKMATKLGIKVINEEQLLEMLGE